MSAENPMEILLWEQPDVCQKLHQTVLDLGVNLQVKSEYSYGNRSVRKHQCGRWLSIEDTENHCTLTVETTISIEDAEKSGVHTIDPCVKSGELADKTIASPEGSIRLTKESGENGWRSLLCLLHNVPNSRVIYRYRKQNGRRRNVVTNPTMIPQSGWFNNYKRFCEVMLDRGRQVREKLDGS